MVCGALLLASFSAAEGALLATASLRNGNYGTGTVVNTFAPNQGGSPGVPGVVSDAEGTSFTATEVGGRSNALINWQLGNDPTFRRKGTVSFLFRAIRDSHVSGSIVGDNYGFNQFHNGQGTFGIGTGRKVNGPGAQDDQLQISWDTWHQNVWYSVPDPPNTIVLEYDRWYDLGFTWGGPTNAFEVWANGTLILSDGLDPGSAFPWGFDSGIFSGFNFGLGDNHERGIDAYNSASGVKFADVSIWDESRPLGDTRPIPEPSTLLLAVAALGGLLRAAAPGRWKTDRTVVTSRQ
jgi:hypothetical protein